MLDFPSNPSTGQIYQPPGLDHGYQWDGAGWNVVGASPTKPFSLPNRIINGNFDIWQRAASQTLSGYGSCDRWDNRNGGTTKTTSRQVFPVGQAEVPGNPWYFCRTVVASVAGAGNYCFQDHKLEDVRSLAGQEATWTFWAKADAPKNIGPTLYTNLGSGGSPSPAFFTPLGLVALTTTWKKYSLKFVVPSIAGMTMGSNSDSYLMLRTYFDAGSSFAVPASGLGQQSGTFDIAHVSLVEGDATAEDDPFTPRLLGEEMELCQRFYQFLRTRSGGYGLGGSGQQWATSLLTRMRVTPSIVLQNDNPSNNVASRTCVQINQAIAEFQLIFAAVGHAQIAFDFIVEAEL